MSAPTLARPDSVPLDTEPEGPLISETDSPVYQATHAVSHEEIAQLAYAVWRQRGSPEGSPETDWIEAEEQLRKSFIQTSPLNQP